MKNYNKLSSHLKKRKAILKEILIYIKQNENRIQQINHESAKYSDLYNVSSPAFCRIETTPEQIIIKLMAKHAMRELK